MTTKIMEVTVEDIIGSIMTINCQQAIRAVFLIDVFNHRFGILHVLNVLT